jgi:elongation factor 1-alpha
LCLN